MNIRNEKGITLVALIVSIIVMIILATVTLTTTFTAYETTKAQKFKAQMKVLQEGVNSFYSDWQTWSNEKEYEYREMLKNKDVEISDAEQSDLKNRINEIRTTPGLSLEEQNELIAQAREEFYNVNSISEEMKLLENSDLPEYFYTKFAGIVQYLDYKKGTYEYIVDGKKLDDLDLTPECYNEVDKKMKELLGDSYNVDTGNELQNSKLLFYKFEEKDIEYIFGIKDIDIPIYINFQNLVIFTTIPVRLNGQSIYTLYSFPDQNEIILSDTKSTMEGASILIDVKANYGTSQKITLTLESYEPSENKNNYVDYRIRKAYYQNVFSEAIGHDGTDELTNKGRGLLKNAPWYEVDELKECEYSEDGKSVSFIVYESGMYRFRLEDVSGAYTTEMKRNTKMNVKNPTNQYSYEKIEPRDNDEDGEIDSVATYNITLCNAPVLNDDMIPVKWVYDDDDKVNGKWEVCTTIDPEWYNYSEDAKMWANVMLVHDTTAKNFEKGTVFSEKEMGSMFVWIPRFDFKPGLYQIRFVRGTSATTTFGNEMYMSTGGSALNAFGISNQENGWDVRLRGLWFAKYDTSLEDNDSKQQINTSDINIAERYDKLYSTGQNFKPTVKPYRITWRNISLTSAFSQALMYYTSLPSASKNKDLNSHMMTDQEYVVLNRIACDNKYGVGIDNNNTPNLSHNSSNKYAGGSDGHGGYSVANFKKQSTNGNMTGVFDFEGTTSVMIPRLTEINVDEKSEEVYDSLGEIINKKDTNYLSKYVSVITDFSNRTVAITEQASNVGEEYRRLNDCISQDIGFRIVIANSPSGDRSNFIYTSKNLANTDASLPGFYLTDDDGNYIRNAQGEFKDENGNSTYISWDEMIDKKYIRIEKGNENAENSKIYNAEDRLVVAGDNFKAFQAFKGIWVISDSVNVIGNSANSYDCKFNNMNFTEVRMPDTITEIADSAFYQCYSLKSVKLSNNLKIIRGSAFKNCHALVNISLPESLETIESSAFRSCQSLESITIPKNVKDLSGSMIFDDCKNVQSIQILAETQNLVIGPSCFSDCDNVKIITIPSNVKEIQANAFYHMDLLETVVIEDGLEIIKADAFSKNKNLTQINIPRTVKLFDGIQIFRDCVKLESIDLSQLEIETLNESCFFGCEKLKTVLLPNTLKKLEFRTFAGCYSLNNLTLPNTIQSIGCLAFGSERRPVKYIDLQIQYQGTMQMWDLITKHPRTGNLADKGNLDYEECGWNENCNITVTTVDGDVVTYRPR